MHMPFGKYRGVEIEEIDRGYLVWVLDNVERLSPALVWAIEEQLERQTTAPTAPRFSIQRTDLDAKLRGWHRELALRYHPDRKGSTEVMAAINDAYDRLRKVLSL